MPTLKPIDRVLRDISTGVYDGDLNRIVEELNKKVALGYIRTRWTVNVAGVQVAEDDMTVDEAWQIEQALDLDWSEIRPYAMSATQRRAVLLIFLRTRRGLTDDEAHDVMKSLKAIDIVAGMTNEIVPGDDEEGRAPLSSGASATT